MSNNHIVNHPRGYNIFDVKKELKRLQPHVSKAWLTYLDELFYRHLFSGGILSKLTEMKQHQEIIPGPDNVLRVFRDTNFDELKVIVVGEEPYNRCKEENHIANGLAFATDIKDYLPPSLQIIFEELKEDTDQNKFELTDFPMGKFIKMSWGIHQGSQGVMLLNTALTVTENKPNSHLKLWQPFTQALIQKLDDDYGDRLVWLLMGKKPVALSSYIKQGTIVTTVNPSPWKRKEFIGSKPFSQVNKILTTNGYSPIIW